MIRKLLVGLALALATTAAPAAAAVLTFDFTGRIDQANALFATGTTLAGTFSYDDALAPTTVVPVPSGSIAQYADPSIALAVTVGGPTFSGTALASVSDDVDGEDGFGLFAFGAPFLSLEFFDPNGASFTGTGLPHDFPALAQGPFPDPNDDDDLTVPSAEFNFYDEGRDEDFTATVRASPWP